MTCARIADPRRSASQVNFNISAVAGIWLVLLTGCHLPLTPQSVTNVGTRTTHTLRREPHLAAVCIARNIDQYRSPYSAQIRPGVAPVLVEVHVRGAQLVSIAELTPSGAGSSALIWMTPEPVYEREALVAAMVEGC